MDFLNKAISQASELFRSMTPGSRILSGLLVSVVVISLVYLFRYQAGGGGEYLLGGEEFSRRDIVAMEAAFANAGLKKSEVAGNRIRVPYGQKDLYLKAAYEAGALPESFDTAIESALDGENWFSSNKLLDSKVRHAEQRKLAKIVSDLNGVDYATVHYSEQRTAGFPPTLEKTALVAVKAFGRKSLSEEQIRSIQDTVAGYVVGLTRENIVVTDLNTGKAHRSGNGSGGVSITENIYLANKSMFEKGWREKLYEMLSMYPGIVVSVNVELDPETDYRLQTLEYKGQPMPVSSSTMERGVESSRPTRGGEPGFTPNQIQGNTGASVSTAATPPQTSSENLSREDSESVVGHQQVSSSKAPLVPKGVRVSILLPRSYYRKVWQEQNPDATDPPAAADLQKIQDDTEKDITGIVRNLLLDVELGENPFSRVVVSNYQDLAEPPMEKPGVGETAFSWFTANWETLGMTVVGLFSLLMLRNMLRPARQAAPAAEELVPSIQLADVDEDESEELADDDEERSTRRFRRGGTNLRQQLAAMVKEDPDTAANILRSWIGDAA